ncbi:hypothetical protein [Limimaricola litoreus]|uniref:Uncharacterized protein n=1 Tax=Limimaricola litoreus TaxID=2955316 RepID=A0A9X2JPQ8_9RHOB|nr:hypothetical protein [Limimaricola litoreus]MCP1169873.1 hypothetical protein [Limimaricola litoreus]
MADEIDLILLPEALFDGEALGLGGELGRIFPGQRASVILLTHELEACGTIVDGQLPGGGRASGRSGA